MAPRTLLLYLSLALVLLLGAQAASADTITYTFQGNATGSVGSTSFTNSAFTITLTANTSSISEFTAWSSTIFDVPATTATLSVDGLNTSITSAIGVFDNQTSEVFGLSRITGPGIGGLGVDLLDMTNPMFATYNLGTPLSTVGPFNMNNMGSFSCSSGCVISVLGNVTMTSASDVSTGDPPVNTPEPASILLLGAGLLAVAGIRRRTRNNLSA